MLFRSGIIPNLLQLPPLLLTSRADQHAGQQTTQSDDAPYFSTVNSFHVPVSSFGFDSKDSASFSSHQHLSQILWCDSCPRKAFRAISQRSRQSLPIAYHEEKKFFPPEGKKKCCLVTCYLPKFCIYPDSSPCADLPRSASPLKAFTGRADKNEPLFLYLLVF